MKTKIDEAVKALKAISNDFENGNDGTSFDICGECMNAAYLLERLQSENKQTAKDRDQWKAVAEASRDVIQPKLRAEIEELKASQPVRLQPIVKERHRGGFQQFTCEECGHINTKDHRYIEKYYWICPSCGKNVDGIFRNYCDNCGQKLEGELRNEKNS